MINTTLCYIEKNDAYLMMHRTKKKNDCNHDKWIGIGGKFEEEESPEDCVIREMKEETGLSPVDIEYRGIVTFVSRDEKGLYYELMHLFWCNNFTGDEKGLPDCPEGDLEWVPKSKMLDLPHWKGDEIFLDLIDKKSDFFSLKLVYENGELIESILNGKKI